MIFMDGMVPVNQRRANICISMTIGNGSTDLFGSLLCLNLQFSIFVVFGFSVDCLFFSLCNLVRHLHRKLHRSNKLPTRFFFVCNSAA